MFRDLNKGVSIGAFQYEGSDTTHHYIENADGEEIDISYGMWDTLIQADGTHPKNMHSNGSQILPKLKRLGLVRRSRFVRDDEFCNSCILFPIGSRNKRDSFICKTINDVLLVDEALFFTINMNLM